MDNTVLIPILLLLSLAGICIAAVLLSKGRKPSPVVLDETLARDREHLERLEAIDQRLELLEKTLHDLPS